MAELAPGLKVEVYTINKNGKETLIGDSSAEKGTETRDNIDAMFSGEYKAKKDTMLYIKITRDDTVSKNEELAYVLQIQQGENISMTMFRKKVCLTIRKTRPKLRSR